MRTMPIEIHGGTVPCITLKIWLSVVEGLLGRPLSPAETEWAVKASEHNWTATVVADAIREGNMAQ